MSDALIEGLKNLETHAEVLMTVPANEQYLANMQAIISIALLEIKRCLEELAK